MSKTALFILYKYNSKDKIAKITKEQYKKISNVSRGKFSYPKFLNLKDIEKEIETLMSMINTKLTTIPGVSLFSGSNHTG